MSKEAQSHELTYDLIKRAVHGDQEAIEAYDSGPGPFTLKDVQEWMGHSDIKMTANIYGHLDTARKQNMADHLSDSLFD